MYIHVYNYIHIYIYIYVYIYIWVVYIYTCVCACELLSQSFIIHLSSSYYRLSVFLPGGWQYRFPVFCVILALQCCVLLSLLGGAISLYSVLCTSLTKTPAIPVVFNHLTYAYIYISMYVEDNLRYITK